MVDRIIEQLTASQRRAVLHKNGPLLVIAGPGSGKTRVITCRIAALINSGVRPYDICAITFTNKAADEMRQRALDLGPCVGANLSTFHSLCVRILRRYADQALIKSNFSIYDDSEQAGCIRQAVKDCGLDSANFSPARMLDAISKLKNRLIDAETFKNEANDFFSTRLADVYQAYQNILTERNGLDFDDLLMKTAFLLRDCPDVCRQLGERFQYLLIDEYQDTNHAQYVIAKYLASLHSNICATGDPDQSIYRWRGADIRNILAFEKDWPNAEIVKLEENFRSCANILAMADGLIANNKNRKEKKLIPTKPASTDVCISACENETDEAHEITQRIKMLTDKGESLGDMAIFYRVNAMSRVLEEAFISNRIPYQIVRGVEFYRRKEIRDLLAYLKILVNPDDEIALLRILNTPARGIGKTTADKIKLYASQRGINFYDALKNAEHIESLSAGTKAKLAVFVKMLEQFKKNISGKVATLVEQVFNKSGLADSLRSGSSKSADPNGSQAALENISELINSAAQYDKQTEQPQLIDYLQQISLFSDADAYQTGSERVALMSLHAAKGLEFENVFIAGVEEGLLPHERSSFSDDDDELEEERRLLFVGITRAKTGLHISYAQYRNIRGQLLRTIPSRFLFELGCEFSEDDDEQDEDYFENRPADSRPSFVVSRPSPLSPGQMVRHRAFGLGRVKSFVDMGPDSVVVIRFNTGQTKALLLKYAELVKVGEA